MSTKHIIITLVVVVVGVIVAGILVAKYNASKAAQS